MVSRPPPPHAGPVGCPGQFLQESCAEACYQSALQHTLRPPHFLLHSSSPRTCLHRPLQMHLKISLLRLSLGPATLLLSALANDCGPLASPKPLRKCPPSWLGRTRSEDHSHKPRRSPHFGLRSQGVRAHAKDTFGDQPCV